MKYFFEVLAIVITMAIVISFDGCLGGRGLYINIDGKEHVIKWR